MLNLTAKPYLQLLMLLQLLFAAPTFAAGQNFGGQNKQITEAQIALMFEGIEQAANASDFVQLGRYYTEDAVLDVTTRFQGKQTHEIVSKKQWFEQATLAMGMIKNYSMKIGKYTILEIKGDTAIIQGTSSESMDMMFQHFEGTSSGVSKVRLVNGQAKIFSTKMVLTMTMSALEQP